MTKQLILLMVLIGATNFLFANTNVIEKKEAPLKTKKKVITKAEIEASIITSAKKPYDDKGFVEEEKASPATKEEKYSEEAIQERQKARRRRRKKLAKKEKIYIAKEGWQSEIGRKTLEDYVNRLNFICNERMPGHVTGVAGGKKGVLISVTFKGKRNFFLAQENTKQFLTAIVEDLEKMPEPVDAQVYITNNGQQIISAMRPRKGQPVKVKYLL